MITTVIIPEDLNQAFDTYLRSKSNFTKFPPSVRRGILDWIFNAKTEKTRKKRISETAQLAEQNVRANQYTHK
ncbi:YdeI/OmpD-associated family protein [Portibacter marinus]|uniref:YdeI/OmpD-associated family protein n=1 Tax=Portibacter marinus TaxID=2898660 RepID=UPI0038735CEC